MAVQDNQIKAAINEYFFKNRADFEAHKNEIANNSKFYIEDDGLGVVTMQTKVLWTNPNSPPISIGEFTITTSEDMSKYDYIAVNWGRWYDEHSYRNISITKFAIGSLLESISGPGTTNSREGEILTNTTIKFGKGYLGSSVNNDADPPISVIGIKLIESPTQITNKYSTEETVVGEWIDGKKIYRKVVDFGAWTISSTVSSKSTSISNIDEVVSCKIFRKLNTDWFTTYNDVAITIKPNGYVEMSQSSSVSWTDVYIILEYTKTTD